ncbi:MAG: HAMP domain-containing protein [Nanoarchaeota archaeon]|nr:HAMP domain-containing protein [Nanoarchaeota archaeon]MBU4452559.1 HAMP domain-containing protein [Nanoarchaeota archaeon]MCG2723524.1 HAMP domain-containing protein [archaeon]
MKSIKTEMFVFLLGLTTVSIFVTGYIGINSIMDAGSNAREIAADSLRSQAEGFLVQLTIASAEKNDLVFENVRKNAGSLADYTKNIFENPKAFSRDNYWKFGERVFTGSGGQYLNGPNDTSSVFVPGQITITGDVKEELELNAYLDYAFPKVLENDQNIVAIWMVGARETSRYYPNIGLGNIVPPDFEATKDIFFTSANPKNNPEQKVVWTPVYDDPAGQGLMISAVAPVYAMQGGFIGVLGIDVTLNKIIGNIEEYNPIEDSYSFLVDKEGYSIALPEQAYTDIVGRARGRGESRVNLNNITNSKFSSVLNKMKAGSTGFENITAGNKNLFIAYAPLKGTEFSMGIVVEEEVLLGAVKTIDKELKNSVRELTYFRILPTGLLILVIAWAAGFFLIGRIVGPVKNLTEAARELSKGNFNVKPDVASENEVGVLAAVFNNMAEDLKKSHGALGKHTEELEQEVAEKTKELKNYNIALEKEVAEKTKELKAHGASLEKQVAERTKELEEKVAEMERFNKIAVGRELKMIELKKRIKELEEKK